MKEHLSRHLLKNLGDLVSPEGERADLEEVRPAPGADGALPTILPAEGGPDSAHFGKYRLIRQVASGGMGVVYEAFDPDLRRRVAIKMLKGDDASPVVIERLHREAVLASRLRHPNIIAIHEVGAVRSATGYMVNYISMDYVDGATLETQMRSPHRFIRDIVSILEQVARAVHYAHGHGIIHRDLKPSNILIDPARGPVVTDFGLAMTEADEEEMARITRSGAVIGTPMYMAPEQASGQREAIDARTDVYALGVTLYEAAAGHPPFRGAYASIFRQIQEEDPAPIRKSNPESGVALESIILKAMSKRKGDRYQTALELAEDLKRYLTDEPVLASPPSLTHRLVQRVRKRKAVLVLALSLMVALAAGSVFYLNLKKSDARLAALQTITRLDNEIDSIVENASSDPHTVGLAADRLCRQLEDLSVQWPQEPGVHLASARAARILGRHDDVEKALNRALELDGGNSVIHYELARHYRLQAELAGIRRLGLFEEEWGALEKEQKDLFLRVTHHLRIAQDRSASGVDLRGENELATLFMKMTESPEEVLHRLDERIALGGAPAPWFVLRSGLQLTRDPQAAVQDIQTALRLLPNDPYVQLVSVTLKANSRLRMLEGPDGATAELSRLIQVQRDSPMIDRLHWMKSHLHWLAGEVPDALTEIRFALKRAPEVPMYHAQLGHLLLWKKDVAGAREALVQALKRAPGMRMTHWYLGDVEFLAGHREEARAHYEICISEISPGKNSIHRNAGLLGRARTSLALGDLDSAERDVREAIRSEAAGRLMVSNNPGYYVLLAEILTARGDDSGAADAYTNALNLYEENPGHSSELIWVYVARYDPKEEDWQRPMVERRRNMWGKVHLSRGLIFRKLGRLDEARKDFESAIECDPLLKSEIPPWNR